MNDHSEDGKWTGRERLSFSDRDIEQNKITRVFLVKGIKVDSKGNWLDMRDGLIIIIIHKE